MSPIDLTDFEEYADAATKAMTHAIAHIKGTKVVARFSRGRPSVKLSLKGDSVLQARFIFVLHQGMNTDKGCHATH